ncbi:MAG: regulatory iron-sulfur-containing complex subunit RicT [Candidatus Eisenbacteria bacterium]
MNEIVEVLFKGERRELFHNPSLTPLAIGDRVIVQVERGEDIGKVLQLGQLVCDKARGRNLRQLVRKATEEDLARNKDNAKLEEDAFRVCEERIAARELRMRLVGIECQFDRNRITFYFTADKRVDFRELVKDLAASFKTRIELRQIGVRDEARRIGGYGLCGQPYCCDTFLKEFEPVTLRMAKEQQLSLSPTKISGACGRLMCCLMYEVDFYRKEARRYPKVGSKVKVGEDEFTVSRLDFLKREVIVQDADGVEKKISIDEVPVPRPERLPFKRRRGFRRDQRDECRQRWERGGREDGAGREDGGAREGGEEARQGDGGTAGGDNPAREGEGNGERRDNREERGGQDSRDGRDTRESKDPRNDRDRGDDRDGRDGRNNGDRQ